MSKHTTALVPLSTWCYNSPMLRANGQPVDFGLLAEALIYYDQVLINVDNPSDLAALLGWFTKQDKFADFVALVKDGTLKIYDFAFMTSAVEKDGVYSIYNLQDPIQQEPNTFGQRYLAHSVVKSSFAHARQRGKLYRALYGNVIEVKADEFANAIENARSDYENERRNALVVQAFVDELYDFRKRGRPPEIQASVTRSPDNSLKHISWNISFDQIRQLAGKPLNFHKGMPLTANAHSNRLLLSAANLDCDLFLSRPMSAVVGDKLYETEARLDKTHNIIATLQGKVEFPDIRDLVNKGQIGLGEVLKIREKARRFRDWLQDESERDRDALFAYHFEVAREAGFITTGRKALSLFGVIGGAAIGSLVSSSMSGPTGFVAGSVTTVAVGFVADMASKLGAGWKPIVFGNWFKQRIEKVLEQDR